MFHENMVSECRWLMMRDVLNTSTAYTIVRHAIEILVLCFSIVAFMLHYRRTNGRFTAPTIFQSWHVLFSAFYLSYQILIEHTLTRDDCLCDGFVVLFFSLMSTSYIALHVSFLNYWAAVSGFSKTWNQRRQIFYAFLSIVIIILGTFGSMSGNCMPDITRAGIRIIYSLALWLISLELLIVAFLLLFKLKSAGLMSQETKIQD